MAPPLFPCGKRWMVLKGCGWWTVKDGKNPMNILEKHTHTYIIYIHGFHMACKKSTICFALRCFSSLLLTCLVAFEGKKTCSTTGTFAVTSRSTRTTNQPTNGFLSQTKKNHLNKTCRQVAFCKDVVRKMTIK